MSRNRKCCDSKFDSQKPPRSGKHRRMQKQPQLTPLDRLNGWTTTKLKKARRGERVALPAYPLERQAGGGLT